MAKWKVVTLNSVILASWSKNNILRKCFSTRMQMSEKSLKVPCFYCLAANLQCSPNHSLVFLFLVLFFSTLIQIPSVSFLSLMTFWTQKHLLGSFALFRETIFYRVPQMHQSFWNFRRIFLGQKKVEYQNCNRVLFHVFRKTQRQPYSKSGSTSSLCDNHHEIVVFVLVRGHLSLKITGDFKLRQKSYQRCFSKKYPCRAQIWEKWK